MSTTSDGFHSSNAWRGWVALFAVGVTLSLAFYGTLKVFGGSDATNRVGFTEFETFTTGDEGIRLLGEGWSGPEEWGSWTNGSFGDVRWPLERRPTSELNFLIKGRIYPWQAEVNQSVHVSVNGTDVATLRRNEDGDLYGANFAVPATVALSQTPMRIRFKVDSPISPTMLNDGTDSRKLGFGLASIEINYDSR